MTTRPNEPSEKLSNAAVCVFSQDEITKRAQEAVTFARDNATEREAVTDMRKVMADALRRNMGLTTYEAVATELHQRIERGEFVEIIRERKPRESNDAANVGNGEVQHSNDAETAKDNMPRSSATTRGRQLTPSPKDNNSD